MDIRTTKIFDDLFLTKESLDTFVSAFESWKSLDDEYSHYSFGYDGLFLFKRLKMCYGVFVGKYDVLDWEEQE